MQKRADKCVNSGNVVVCHHTIVCVAGAGTISINLRMESNICFKKYRHSEQDGTK